MEVARSKRSNKMKSWRSKEIILYRKLRWLVRHRICSSNRCKRMIKKKIS